MDRNSFGSNRWRQLPSQIDDTPRMDSSVVTGISIACAIVVFGALLGGEPSRFISPAGLLLVLGGTAAAAMMQFSLKDLKAALEDARSTLFVRSETVRGRVQYLVHLARRLKEGGKLVLENEASSTNDTFLRLGLELTVDEHSPEEIRRILENEKAASAERNWRSAQVWETMGNISPALGLIGTLIGLIHMLGSLRDPAAVGPAMSLALVATLYGAISANLFFFPISGKLKLIAREKAQLKEVTLEALMSFGREESPIVLEQKLQSFSSLVVNG